MVEFADKDQPLRDDVHELGVILGQILRDQGGTALYERVEAARVAARHRRAGDEAAEVELFELLHDLPANFALEVVQAFSAYFSLVNMAERIHRVRRARTYGPDSPQPGSLSAVVTSLKANGISADEVRATLARMRIMPVLTAHPTEAVRRSLLTKSQRIARALTDRIDPDRLTVSESQAALARVRAETSIAWQTEEHSRVGPTVADEAEHIAFYLTDVIYRVVPAFYEELEETLVEVYGDGAPTIESTDILRFGSWVGGDMDGNPNVDADTLRATLARHRELILKKYRTDIQELFARLSQSRSRAAFDPAIDGRLDDYRERMPEVLEGIPERYHDMPYRMLLWTMAMRIDATLAEEPHGYRAVSGLIADLRCITDSLEHNKGQHAGLFKVRRLLRRVETFGFHLASVDVRQDAWVHRELLGKLLDDDSYDQRGMDERAETLRQRLAAGISPVAESPDRTLAMLRAMGEMRERYGAEAVGPYIISMAQGPDDVLAVLFLARTAGLVDDRGAVPLDVCPLFETNNDLDRAGDTLRSMFGDSHYREHLATRGDHQVVMLGYSDSSKRAGLAASRWALYWAQQELARVAHEAGIRLTLFHGRGGTVSRGGSKPRSGILAQPRGVADGRLRLTEQGEIIHAKYGLRGIAMRTLELMAGAVLETTAHEGTSTTETQPWRDAMTMMAHASRASFRSLVYGDPGFYPYFRTATPIDVIERLHIGSRPASRRQQKGIEDLRAIPWVFAWVQSRHLLPGWYGVAAGLRAAIDAYGADLLREMLAEWPFFANLLADTEMVLAKADLGIARRYAQLADRDGARVFLAIRDEYERTCEMVCEVRNAVALLADEPVLRRNIQLRNPYVDPMSLVQVDLLRRWRQGGRQDPELEAALFATVRGIARGMQNTG